MVEILKFIDDKIKELDSSIEILKTERLAYLKLRKEAVQEEKEQKHKEEFLNKTVQDFD